MARFVVTYTPKGASTAHKAVAIADTFEEAKQDVLYRNEGATVLTLEYSYE